MEKCVVRRLERRERPPQRVQGRAARRVGKEKKKDGGKREKEKIRGMPGYPIVLLVRAANETVVFGERDERFEVREKH